jgi:hypothetical protein
MEAIQEGMAAIERPLTVEQKTVLDYFKAIMYRRGNNSKSPMNDMSRDEFERLDFYAFPYYQINKDAFAANPDPGNLLSHLEDMQDRIHYIGKKDGEIATHITGYRATNGQWSPAVTQGGVADFKKYFSWLPVELAKSDDGKCFLLNAYGSDFFVFHQGGEPVFFGFSGQYKYDKMQFCRMMSARKDDDIKVKAWLKERGMTLEEALQKKIYPPDLKIY